MRHLHRTHRVDIAVLHETFERELMKVEYTKTTDMAADIHTKSFTSALKWKAALSLINVLSAEAMRN